MIRKEVEKAMNAEVVVNKVTKNNGIELTGLSVRAEGLNISPVVYIDSYVEALENKELTINEVVEKIIATYEANKVTNNFDVNQLASCKVRARLINKAENMDLLEGLVYENFLDLAIIYSFEVESLTDSECQASVKITNQLLSALELSLEDIKSRMIEDIKVQTMFEALTNMVDISEVDKSMLDDSPMIIITNSNNLFGAVNLTNTAVLETMANKLEDDLFILPSSIHELIVIPASIGQVDYLRNMVEMINQSEAAMDERLSNNVYKYVRGSKAVTIAE